MPAIQLARLKKQVAELADYFHDPSALLRALFELLDNYADRTRRHGQAGEPPPLRNAHNVPAPVLRQIIKELSSLAANYPKSGLELCDSLWEQAYLEENLLAAHLLGSIGLEHTELILDRIQRWLATKPGEQIVDTILAVSLATIRRTAPETVVTVIEDWIDEPDPYYKQVGLKAMLTLVKEPDFADLAVIFRLVNPMIRSNTVETKTELLVVLQALARRTPKETAYNLRNLLESSENSAAPWYIRQTLKYYPAQIQMKLHSALHAERDR